MAYLIQWHIPQRVLQIKLSGEVSLQDMVKMIDETHTYVNSGQAPVHILIDATDYANTPVNFQEISKIAPTMGNPNTGWWVLINPGKMMWFTSTILSKLLGVKIKTSNSLEEALLILERVDLSLQAVQH